MGCDNCIWRPLPRLADITLLFRIRIRCGKGEELEVSTESFAKIAVLRTVDWR